MGTAPAFYGSCSYSTNASSSSTADFTLADLQKTMREMTQMEDKRRKERDAGFAEMRSKGIGIWSWDCGRGETWVIDDISLEAIKKTLPVDSGPTDMGIYGVAVIKLSHALSMGFWISKMEPVTHGILGMAFDAIEEGKRLGITQRMCETWSSK